MPTFIVHEMGKPPRTASFDLPQITLGRDDGCEVVLNNASVSRQHALITEVHPGQWTISPLNEQNPILVNGEIVPGQTMLGEGWELQIGRFFVVFSLHGRARPEYLQDRKSYAATCRTCSWEGVLSAMARSAACPKCGSSQLKRSDDMSSDTARKGPVISGPTAYLQPKDVEKIHARLKEAKTSRLERVDSDLLPQRVPLTETKQVRFGKDGESEMPISGLRFGPPATLRWDKAGFVVEKGGFWPALKVNGTKVTRAQLKGGDLIELGGNAFRFTTD